MSTYVALPIGSDVATFLGRGGDQALASLAGAQIPIVAAMVRAYVRDVGFDDTSNKLSNELAAVIVSATARLASNPTGLTQQSVGPFQASKAVFKSWTLNELSILNRYRKRAE